MTTHQLVATEASGRLDRFLAIQTGASRTAVQRWISNGWVSVNGRAATASVSVAVGDEIRWEVAPEVDSVRPKAEKIPLEVVFQDDQLLVINKPKGLVVHPAAGHPDGTLVNALLGHLSESGGDRDGDEFAEVGPEDRPGIVHRLDRDTSGLMLVALTELSMASLQQQIASREVDRRYLAVVYGTPSFQEAEVEAPIGRDPRHRQQMAVLPPGSPHRHREALTRLTVLRRYDGFAQLEARLHTGRTHQIRVHCEYIRLPVVGDPLYGPRKLPPAAHRPGVREAIAQLQGQALHAYRLEFRHPTSDQWMSFQSDPPEDHSRLVNALEAEIGQAAQEIGPQRAPR